MPRLMNTRSSSKKTEGGMIRHTGSEKAGPPLGWRDSNDIGETSEDMGKKARPAPGATDVMRFPGPRQPANPRFSAVLPYSLGCGRPVPSGSATPCGVVPADAVDARAGGARPPR